MIDVVIVDYGLCNLDSVYRAVQECGGHPVVTEDPSAASEAGRIILPGVGNYAEATKALTALGWVEALRQEVLGQGIPMLGICLGMQLLSSAGTEGGETAGLGLIPGRVVRFEQISEAMRVPHVGWNEVEQKQQAPLFEGIDDGKDFYFVHSYHFVPDNEDDVLALTPYGNGFVSVVGRGNVVGTQFHPEKSLKIGFALLRNFLTRY